MTASYGIVPGARSFPGLNLVQLADSLIIKSPQRKYFSNELKIFGKTGILNKKSSI